MMWRARQQLCSCRVCVCGAGQPAWLSGGGAAAAGLEECEVPGEPGDGSTEECEVQEEVGAGGADDCEVQVEVREGAGGHSGGWRELQGDNVAQDCELTIHLEVTGEDDGDSLIWADACCHIAWS